jgi:cytochrome c oxidase subunit 2
MILPEAASEHGVKIDEMFTDTTVLTMIVFCYYPDIVVWILIPIQAFNDKRRGISYRITIPSKKFGQ